MKTNRSTALIEKGKDGVFGIFTPELNHTIIGEGKTVIEAKDDFQNSVVEMIASYTGDNKEVPYELRGITFEYKYDIASFFDYYDFINISKFAARVGINASLLRQYKSGTTNYISESQMKKIENALHKVGSELSNLQLV
ncbi:MAG: pilus assembly protein HicB [Proteiniphilum sp.]|nr:pilus assembly protein HicB [Proteiniphilum sp.]